MPNPLTQHRVLSSRSPMRVIPNLLVNQEFTHQPNGRIEYTVVNPATGNTDLNFRQQDTSNTWRSHINTGGTFALIEVIAGANNIRHTASGVVAGDRIALEFNGPIITGYVNGVQKWQRTTATAYQTATTGRGVAVVAGLRNVVVYQ